jgi:hypothetical protein
MEKRHEQNVRKEKIKINSYNEKLLIISNLDSHIWSSSKSILSSTLSKIQITLSIYACFCTLSLECHTKDPAVRGLISTVEELGTGISLRGGRTVGHWVCTL